MINYFQTQNIRSTFLKETYKGIILKNIYSPTSRFEKEQSSIKNTIIMVNFVVYFSVAVVIVPTWALEYSAYIA
jgi:hypothetical protein